jgi:hypothetical protein
MGCIRVAWPYIEAARKRRVTLKVFMSASTKREFRSPTSCFPFTSAACKTAQVKPKRSRIQRTLNPFRSFVWKEIRVAQQIEELRESRFHQELGQKICAAFIAQQQGIALNTALKKVSPPIGDLWLMLAELTRLGCDDYAEFICGIEVGGRAKRSIS